ncbi:MAG: hypothetical protein JSW06_09390 [Thermoplasmatales archaeon]|nr:MAG: hypothetical protein JSW06_09390 [Thermoplasmatales archaeon]
MEEISYNTIYRLLKYHIKNPITREYVYYVKKHLEEIIKQIAEESIIELNCINELRRFHNLPPLKRIHTTKVLNTHYSYAGIGKTGDDQTKARTVLSQAVEIT